MRAAIVGSLTIKIPAAQFDRQISMWYWFGKWSWFWIGPSIPHWWIGRLARGHSPSLSAGWLYCWGAIQAAWHWTLVSIVQIIFLNLILNSATLSFHSQFILNFYSELLFFIFILNFSRCSVLARCYSQCATVSSAHSLPFALPTEWSAVDLCARTVNFDDRCGKYGSSDNTRDDGAETVAFS